MSCFRLMSLVCLVLVTACDDDPAPGPSPGPGPIAPAGCATPSGSGTEHKVSITADETWTAAASPHRVTADITVRGATLTIEPCATVIVSAGRTITIGENTGAAARLIALGGEASDALPIVFSSPDAATYWGALSIQATGGADLSGVTLRRAGDPGTAQSFGGAIVVFGDDNRSEPRRTVRARNVRIEDAAGFGLNLQRSGGFTTDSKDVVVTGSGQAPPPGAIDSRYPVYVTTPSVQAIPEGTYTGNARDAILVAAGTSFDGDETFHQRGVPYRIKDSYAQSPTRSLADGGLATLTIEPGVTLKLLNSGGNVWSFNLGVSSGPAPANVSAVRLVAAGTAAAPITFTSDADSPAPGDWGGIEWSGGPATGNVMTHVIVEYAGGDSSTLGFGCGPGDNDSLLLFKNWKPGDAFITESTFRHSAAGGIVSGWAGAQGDPDLRGTNTFVGIANGCEISVPDPPAGACPGNDSLPDCY